MAAVAAPITPSQIAIVKSTAPLLKEHGVEITTLFYGNMLKAHPELHNIFSDTNQATGRQPRALAGAVLAYATHVDDLGQLSAAVERIAQKHASLGVTAAQYAIVGEHLIPAVAAVLGAAAVTPEVAAAWAAAYAALAAVFVRREARLYDEFDAGAEGGEGGGWRGWRRFRVQRKAPESAEITSFYLAPEDGRPLPLFRPGQYVSLHVFVPELGYLQPRQYSLSDAPRGDYYRISVKREEGGVAGIPGLISNRLHAAYEEGDILELTHPAGEFFVDPTALPEATAPLALISAGVGITPMVSILNSTVASGSRRPIAWVHGAHSSEARAFGGHIREVVAKNPNVAAAVFLSTVRKEKEVRGVDYHHEGRVNLDKLDPKRLLFLDDATAEYYVCGPFAFMSDIKNYLVAKGVDAGNVHMEVFGSGDE